MVLSESKGVNSEKQGFLFLIELDRDRFCVVVAYVSLNNISKENIEH